jgi:hypothetical protein
MEHWEAFALDLAMQRQAASWDYRDRLPLPMADFECGHGFLPNDNGVTCECWGGRVLLHMTRPQVVALFSVAMIMPTDAEFEVVDRDNQGNVTVVASNDLGRRSFKLFERGGQEEVK